MTFSQLIDELRNQIALADIKKALEIMDTISKNFPDTQKSLILFQNRLNNLLRKQARDLTTESTAMTTIIHGLLEELDNLEKTQPCKLKNKRSQKPECIDTAGVFGRTLLLNQLHQRLDTAQAKPLVLVNGIGGIGKTTVAQAYVSTDIYRDTYDRILWIPNCNDTTQQLLAFFQQHGATFPPTALPAEKRKALGIYLQQFTGNNLLVLDNADRSAPLLEVETLLAQSGWKVLLTSRVQLPQGTKFQVLSVKHLSPEAAGQLFRKFYTLPIPAEGLKVLLKKVEYHALLIDLIAKAANEMDLAFEDITPILDKDKYDAEELQADIFSDNQLSKKGERKYVQLYSHLLNIFNAVDLSAEQQRFLTHFAVLPSLLESRDKLYDYFQLKDISKPTFTKILKQLVTNGWLIQEDHEYRLHPMMGFVVRKQLKPDLEVIRGLVAYFSNKAYTQLQTNPLLALSYLPYSLAIWNSLDRESVEVTDIGLSIAQIYQAQGAYEKALAYGEEVVAIRERILEENADDLAIAYNDLALIYMILRKYDKAITANLKNIAITEALFDEKHSERATAYEAIGHTYNYNGQHKEALEYQLKTVTIREGFSDKKHPHLALAYNNIANIYSALGKSEEDLKYCKKALAIQKEILDAKHPHLALAYNNIAITYHNQQNYILAKEYIDQAVAIRAEILPPTHPDFANSKSWQTKIHAIYQKQQAK